MITQEILKSYLTYDPDTGHFVRNRDKKILGTKHSTGYIVIRLNKPINKLYKAHRLAWLYIYGYFPKNVIDHINRDGFDNKLSNLREITQKQNSENRLLNKNNTSGFKGVSWSKNNNKWRARIWNNKKEIFLGFFDEKIDAVNSYIEAARKFHTVNPYVN